MQTGCVIAACAHIPRLPLIQRLAVKSSHHGLRRGLYEPAWCSGYLFCTEVCAAVASLLLVHKLASVKMLGYVYACCNSTPACSADVPLDAEMEMAIV